jgi:hypothetical protein
MMKVRRWLFAGVLLVGCTGGDSPTLSLGTHLDFAREFEKNDREDGCAIAIAGISNSTQYFVPLGVEGFRKALELERAYEFHVLGGPMIPEVVECLSRQQFRETNRDFDNSIRYRISVSCKDMQTDMFVTDAGEVVVGDRRLVPRRTDWITEVLGVLGEGMLRWEETHN